MVMSESMRALCVLKAHCQHAGDGDSNGSGSRGARGLVRSTPVMTWRHTTAMFRQQDWKGSHVLSDSVRLQRVQIRAPRGEGRRIAFADGRGRELARAKEPRGGNGRGGSGPQRQRGGGRDVSVQRRQRGRGAGRLRLLRLLLRLRVLRGGVHDVGSISTSWALGSTFSKEDRLRATGRGRVTAAGRQPASLSQHYRREGIRRGRRVERVVLFEERAPDDGKTSGRKKRPKSVIWWEDVGERSRLPLGTNGSAAGWLKWEW